MGREWGVLLATLMMASAARSSAGADAAPGGHSANETQPAQQLWFGVAVENLPPAIAKQLKLDPLQGLMVDAVMHDSPAERAGLKPDDILIKLDGSILKSQTELASAANVLDAGPSGPVPHASTLVYRREGDEFTIKVTPVVRPVNMQVSGARLGDFTASPRLSPLAERGPTARNYVLPNDGVAQVGPGYRLNIGGSDFKSRSLREVVSKGKTIILSQEVDAGGMTHNSITVGDKVYPVERGQLDALPEDLRPLGEELLSPAAQTGPGTQPSEEGAPLSEQQRIEKLERDKQELQRQLDDANSRLQKIQGGK